MNTSSKRILLRERFGPLLSTRQAARELFDELRAERAVVEFDFEGVIFVSRSFAHEFLRDREASPVVIRMSNVAPDVAKIFDLVQRARQNTANGTPRKIAHYTEVTDPTFVF